MLKNTPMRILAITFALALVGCVDDDGVTPVGVDDIEENTDDFGPDILKGDVDGNTTARPDDPTVGNVIPRDPTLLAPQVKGAVVRVPELNAVPVRPNAQR